MLPGWIPTLLAERGLWVTLADFAKPVVRGGSTQQSPQSVVTAVLWSCAALLAIWLAAWAWRRLARWVRSTPRWLFHQLCKAHRLKWQDRRLLWQVANEQYPRNPALLFVHPDSLSVPKLRIRRRVDMERLAALGGQLFREPEETPKPDNASSLEPAVSKVVPPQPHGVPAIDVSTLFDNTPLSAS